jgi:hypothetical protein
MRSSRVGRVVAVAACVGAGLVLHVPGVSATPAAGSLPAVHGHPRGFFVAGHGRVTAGTNAAAFVRDPQGGEHVVTVRRDTGLPGHQGHVVYKTKQPSARHWVTHRVHGRYRKLGRLQVEAHLGSSGPRVFVVIYTCHGVFSSVTPTGSARLPAPTRMSSVNTCHQQAPKPDAPPIAHAFDGGAFDIMLPDPAENNALVIWEGEPGDGPPKPTRPLPTDHNFVPVQLARDYGDPEEAIAVGYGSDGTNLGIYISAVTLVNEDDDDLDWSEPTRIATLHSPTKNYTIEALTIKQRSAWVGLSLPHGSKHTLFVDHGSEGLQTAEWTGARPLAHTGPLDTGLRLVYNPKSRHLHAAFTRENPASKVKGSGIMKEKLLTKDRGGDEPVSRQMNWTKPTFVTHWYHDFADEIMLNRKGGTVIAYSQR